MSALEILFLKLAFITSLISESEAWSVISVLNSHNFFSIVNFKLLLYRCTFTLKEKTDPGYDIKSLTEFDVIFKNIMRYINYLLSRIKFPTVHLFSNKIQFFTSDLNVGVKSFPEQILLKRTI